jgi:hypothetical protein
MNGSPETLSNDAATLIVTVILIFTLYWSIRGLPGPKVFARVHNFICNYSFITNNPPIMTGSKIICVASRNLNFASIVMNTLQSALDNHTNMACLTAVSANSRLNTF